MGASVCRASMRRVRGRRRRGRNRGGRALETRSERRKGDAKRRRKMKKNKEKSTARASPGFPSHHCLSSTDGGEADFDLASLSDASRIEDDASPLDPAAALTRSPRDGRRGNGRGVSDAEVDSVVPRLRVATPVVRLVASPLSAEVAADDDDDDALVVRDAAVAPEAATPPLA